MKEGCIEFPDSKEDSDNENITPEEDNKIFQLFAPRDVKGDFNDEDSDDEDLPIIYCNTFVVVVD